MREYNDLVGLISQIEQASPKPSVNHVKMEVEAGELLSIEHPRNYSQLLSEIAKADSTLLQFTKKKAGPVQTPIQRAAVPPLTQPPPKMRETLKAAPAPAVQQKPIIQEQAKPSQTPQPQKAWSIFGFPQRSAQQPVVQPKTAQPPAAPTSPPPKAQAQLTQIVQPAPKAAPPPPIISLPQIKQILQPSQPPLEKSASNELAAAMNVAGIKQQPQPAQAIELKQEKGLVLPALSLTDQVAELDKIIENLKRKSFDSYQMKIVKEEVQGLSSIISSQPQPTMQPSAFEQDLIAIRKSRLIEALSLLNRS